MTAETLIHPPLTNDVIQALHIGDKVFISGTIYTARDAAHQRLIGLVKEGKELPFNLSGQIIYYVGPTPPKPGDPIGSAGPTTSYRMDTYTPTLLKLGMKGMIGKGARNQEVINSIKKYKAIYFAATGGAGALISKAIKKAKIVAYEDLGPEAIREIEVENFPVIVAHDGHGNDLYTDGKKRYRSF